MARLMNYKNTWGSPASGVDQQRSDLFYVQLQLPAVLGGTGAWNSSIAFAIEKFPFPERTREMIPVKYMNQTNYQLGADTQQGPVDITVRYAFNQITAELLEKWSWLTSNPITGAVGLSSQIKTNGQFWWLVPAPVSSDFTNSDGSNTMQQGGTFFLEGVMVRGFKPSDADMTSTNGLVSYNLSLQIDRYYPSQPSDLTFGTLSAQETQVNAQ